MAQNYYQILGLKNSATEQQILEAYRKLALVTHPFRETVMLKERQTKMNLFAEISQAFEVLSNARLRAVYDNQGEDGLKKDQRGPTGELIGGYRFKNNALQIFDRFYLETNPFAQLLDIHGYETKGSLFGTAFGGQSHQPLEKKEDLEVTVECNLQDFALGQSREIAYKKQKKTLDLRAIYEVETKKTIFIKPGYGEQTVLRFEGEGHEYYNHSNSDLVIRFREMPHACFERSGDDLFFLHSLSLSDALACEPWEVTLLNGKVMSLTSDEVIAPTTVKKVEGEGMPILNENGPLATLQKGDLYVKFDIQFPSQMTPEQKKAFIEWSENLLE